MNLMNLLMLFVMIGIGADYLFVVCGSFQKAKGTIAERVEQAVDEAVAACFITTWKTAFEFSANISSSIAPIRDFAVYSTLVVMFNYILVVTWVPAWLVIIESWKKKNCLPACRLRGSLCLPPRSQTESDVQPTTSRAFAVFPKLNLEGNLVACGVHGGKPLKVRLSKQVYDMEYIVHSICILLESSVAVAASQRNAGAVSHNTPRVFGGVWQKGREGHREISQCSSSVRFQIFKHNAGAVYCSRFSGFYLLGEVTITRQRGFIIRVRTIF